MVRPTVAFVFEPLCAVYEEELRPAWGLSPYQMWGLFVLHDCASLSRQEFGWQVVLDIVGSMNRVRIPRIRIAIVQWACASFGGVTHSAYVVFGVGRQNVR